MLHRDANVLRFVIAQINTAPGAVQHNRARIAEVAVAHSDAELVVFPEMTLSGYPIADLVHRPDFLNSCREAATQLAKQFAGGPALVIGAPWLGVDLDAHVDRVQGSDHTPIFNAVLLLQDGEVHWISSKYHLPNEGIFDEKRNFAPAQYISGPVDIAGMRLGVMVCHDAWFEDVAETMAESGADGFVVLNASPYQRDGKVEKRFQVLLKRVVETRKPLLMVNLVGAQDGVVFDGASLVLNADCSVAYQAPSFVEDIQAVDWQQTAEGWMAMVADFCPQEESVIQADVYQAIILGLRDFVAKNRFEQVLIGLSGGVDSALVATLAVDALSAERVHCVMMPSPHTSQQSLDDAQALVNRLGVRYNTIPISGLMQGYDQ
ncbi:MAG: NAD+ synthase, partial [Alphaproteobacteria bacterium]|nr:NAD+ synthase [Alphaproteobacteria bacterium]